MKKKNTRNEEEDTTAQDTHRKKKTSHKDVGQFKGVLKIMNSQVQQSPLLRLGFTTEMSTVRQSGDRQSQD